MRYTERECLADAGVQPSVGSVALNVAEVPAVGRVRRVSARVAEARLHDTLQTAE